MKIELEWDEDKIIYRAKSANYDHNMERHVSPYDMIKIGAVVATLESMFLGERKTWERKND